MQPCNMVDISAVFHLTRVYTSAHAYIRVALQVQEKLDSHPRKNKTRTPSEDDVNGDGARVGEKRQEN